MIVKMGDKMTDSLQENDPTKEARLLIENEKKERVARCEAKINQALQEENCGLDVAVMITARGNVPQLNIFAQD